MSMRRLGTVCCALLATVTGTASAATAAAARAPAAAVVRYEQAGPAAAPPATPSLSGVAAISGRDAWAVGGHVILRWNGAGDTGVAADQSPMPSAIH